MHEFSGSITPVPPFDFAPALAFLEMFTPAKGTHSLAGSAIAQAIVVDAQTIVFRVQSSGTVEAPRLDYRLFSDQPIDPATAEAAQDRIGFFLSVDDDLKPFYALAAGDAPFAPVVQELYGYHQVKFITPFDNAVWAILSQRVPIAQGSKLKQKVAEQYGPSLTVEGTLYRAFPSPAQLLAVDEIELGALLNNPVKAERVLDAARHFATVDESWLRSAPYAEAETWLKGIKGIGDWAANFVLLRGLGRMDCVPVSEKRLYVAAEQVYGRSFTPDELTQMGARYGEHQGYWAHYLRIGKAKRSHIY